MRKILLGLILLGIFISSTVFSQGYHISGNQIVDNTGNACVFKGTNVNGSNWVWDGSTKNDSDLISNVWNFNLIRVNCLLYGNHYSDNNDLDKIVRVFTRRNVAVMLEVHDFTGAEPTESQLVDLKQWWVEKAKKYKDNSWVWFNIENEPVDSWINGGVGLTTRWRDVHEQCIGAIRETGAENICICDDNGWGAGGWKSSTSGTLTYGKYLASKYSNVAFGVHVYDDNQTSTKLIDWFNKILDAGLCPIVGEFGIQGGSDVKLPNTPTNVFKALYSSDRLKNIARIGWHWRSGDANDYTTTGNGAGNTINKIDGTKPTNLTSTYGSLVWDDNHGTLDFTNTSIGLNYKYEQEPSVYPNPINNGSFKLNLGDFDKSETVQIQILNLNGKIVYTSCINTDNISKIVVVNANIIKGLYLVNIITEKKVHSLKLLYN